MNTTNQSSLSERIAQWCSALDYQNLPIEVTDRTKYLLLDYLGCALRGVLSDSTRPVHGLIRNNEDPGGTVAVAGTDLRCEASIAALAMGMAAHSLELDDVVNSASLHPGVAVMSAALAIGYEQQCSGAELLTAIVAGYEVTVRLGIAVNPGAHYARGFHPTGTCGTFGCGVTAARLLNLEQDALRNAIGIAGSQAAGSMEFLSDGSYTKRFHPGWAAHSGIIAAQLAQHGLTGPASIIEGKFGFLRSYSSRPDSDAVLRDWANPYQIMRTSIKPHACCRYKQGAIDCILELIQRYNLQPQAIEQVNIAILEAGFALVAEPQKQKINPESVVDAQFSMPFGAALAILRKDASLDRYCEQELAATDIKEMMEKVNCIRDASIEKQFPDKWPARVEIITRDGQHLSHALEYPKGDPENPLSWAEIIDKFKTLATPVFADERCDELIDLVRNIEQQKNIRELIDRLVP